MNKGLSGLSLEQVLEAMGEGEEFINNTSPLLGDDYRVIGEFIQMYCWADLNGRRLINQLRRINRQDEEEFASRLSEVSVLEHLEKEADNLTVLPDVKRDIVKAVSILNLHRQRRHEFSHWSIRRVSGHDFYTMLTMNAKEAKIRGVEQIGSGSLSFGLMSVISLKEELVKLNSHIEHLAGLVAILAKYQDSLEVRN